MRNFIDKLTKIILSGAIGIMSIGVSEIQIKDVNNSLPIFETKQMDTYQPNTNVSAQKNENKSEKISNPNIVNCSHKGNCQYSKETLKDHNNSERIYRTKTGKCYHKGNCKCLKYSKIEISQNEAKQADLKSCKKCCK